jgi:hypothetical protein
MQVGACRTNDGFSQSNKKKQVKFRFLVGKQTLEKMIWMLL